jgi:hypothetical protein
MNFFCRLEEKQQTSKEERKRQEAERRRVMTALAQHKKISLVQFTRKGLAAAVVYLETHGMVRRVGGNELGEGAFIEVVS